MTPDTSAPCAAEAFLEVSSWQQPSTGRSFSGRICACRPRGVSLDFESRGAEGSRIWQVGGGAGVVPGGMGLGRLWHLHLRLACNSVVPWFDRFNLGEDSRMQEVTWGSC